MRLYAVTSIVCLLAAATTTWAGENLLPNGGFEQGEKAPTGWSFTVWSHKPSRGSFEWSTEAHSGERAARLVGIENAGKEHVRCLLYSSPVNIEAGLLTLRGWYRTQGDAWTHIQISVYAEEFAAKQFSTPVQETIYRYLDPAPEWSPFEFDINIKQGARQAVITLRATDIGEVYYDDVSLERVDDPLVFRIYPAEYGRNNTVPLVRGTPSFFSMPLIGDRQRVGAAELVLDLPEGVGGFGVSETGAPAVYATAWYRIGFDVIHGAPVERAEGRFWRFRIPVHPKTLALMRKTISNCRVTIWVDTAEMPEQGMLFCRAVVDGVEYAEKQVAVKVLPSLAEGPRPSQFHSLFYDGLFLGDDVPEPLYPAVYDMVRAIGVDHLQVYGDAQGEIATTLGWRSYLMERMRKDGGKLWAALPSSYAGIYKGRGSPDDGPWATSAIAEGKSYFARDNGYYETMAPHIDGVLWDWEPYGPQENPCWDDPATLRAFAEKSGLDPATVTTELAQGELREEFLQFRAWQLGEFMRLWAAYVHDKRPDLTIAICQGSGVPIGDQVDYRAYDDIPNLIHLPMIYTSDTVSFTERAANMAAYLPQSRIMPMTSTFMIVGSGSQPTKSPRTIYFDYLHMALLGAYGISHWPDLDRAMDMEYVWEISRAMRDIGSVEGFLFGGARNPDDVSVRVMPENEARIKTAGGEVTIVSPRWDRFAMCFSYRLKQSTLVAVSNMHPEKPATVEVRIAGARGGGWFAYDPVTKAALLPARGKTWKGSKLAQGLLYEVPASSLGMLVIGRQAPEGGFAGETRVSEVRRRFEARCAEAKAAGDISTLRSGDLEINWEDMDGDGNAEIRIASEHQELGLGPSGNLWSWKVRGREQDLVSRFDGGGACQDQFWWPEAARVSDDKQGEYELVVREIKGGRAMVAFRRALSHWALGGLIVEKTYSITEGAPEFDVRVTIRNESPDVHEFSYWSHNCFSVGGLPTLAFASTEGGQLFSGEQQPREIWAPVANPPPDQAELITAPSTATLTGSSFALGDPSGPHIEVSVEPSVLQLYRWWDGTSGGRYTLEWMYQRQELLSGQMWFTRFQVSWK